MNNTRIINTLLVFSVINLTLMIPGGFIESRDFSHLSPIVLGGFNIFLTLLGMISLFVVYFVHKEQKWALKAAFLCGLGYFIVYLIDLMEIFPKTPTAMPLSLLVLEFLGLLLAIAVMLYTMFSKRGSHNDEGLTINKYIYVLIALSVVIGIGIIIFATKSAMAVR